MPRPEQAVSRDALEARAVLLSLLEAAYGSTDDGRAALERALRGAERTELPASVSDLLSFVRTGLLPVLSEDLGPRLTMTLLEDFIAAYEIRTGVTVKESATRARVTPRPREQRVLLVDADRVGRTTLARGLARQKCLVTIAASLEELGQIARSGEEIDTAVLDGRLSSRLLFMEVIADRFPGVSLVVRTDAEDTTRTLLHALGVERFELVPVEASVDTLVAAVLRVASVPSP